MEKKLTALGAIISRVKANYVIPVSEDESKFNEVVCSKTA